MRGLSVYPPKSFFQILGLAALCGLYSVSIGCSLGPWTSEQTQVDRFRHELALTNFRLQRSHMDEVRKAFADSRDLAAYSGLVDDFASKGTSRLKERLETFESIQVFVGTETFAVCLLKKAPPLLICDTSETPYIDRIQIDQPLPDMKSSLDRVSGR
jgi:hypothetical protein